MGQRFLEMGLPDSAEAALHRSLEISPNNFYAQRYLSYCPYYRGDINRSIALQEALLQRSSLMPGERMRLLSGHPATPDLPMLYTEQGRFKKTLGLFKPGQLNSIN